jgi:hypothetical protein
MGTKMYEAGKYSKRPPFEQMLLNIEENLRLRSCFICFHNRITKQNNTLSGYQFENFVSSYPKK